jgi:hypothetical protein
MHWENSRLHEFVSLKCNLGVPANDEHLKVTNLLF